jgi:hypothetical protein
MMNYIKKCLKIPKGVIRSRKSTDGTHNDQKEKEVEKTNNIMVD